MERIKSFGRWLWAYLKQSDLIRRAAGTFWQAFAIVFVFPLDALDLSAWETTLTAAGAAGLSAVKTFVVGRWFSTS